jgi:hypothetical protein
MSAVLSSLLSCARYTVQGELQQVRQDRTADIHVVFLIQLPGITPHGCQQFYLVVLVVIHPVLCT